MPVIAMLLAVASTRPRKAQQLKFTARMSKLSDLQPAVLAASVSRLVPQLTENALMKMGGNLLGASSGSVLYQCAWQLLPSASASCCCDL